MGRQFHINMTGRDAVIIDLIENESVSVRIDNPPRAFGCIDAPTNFDISGLRWTDTEHFHLGRHTGEMQINDSFTVKLIEDNQAPTPLERDEKYIAPKMHCDFCRKKQSEVRYLVDWSLMVTICDECVEACQDLIEKRRASKNPETVIIDSTRARSLMKEPRPRNS